VPSFCLSIQASDVKCIVKCSFCEEVFESTRQLNKHHNKQHRNINRYKCCFCDQSYATASILHQHERVHMNAAHGCPHCNRSFLDARSLRMHISSRHVSLSQDKERPFLCRLCGKCFRYDFTYEAHMSSHRMPTERRAAAIVALNNGCGKKVMKKFHIKLVNDLGQGVAYSSTVDPYAFIERFVELPACDVGSWSGKGEEDEGEEHRGGEEGEENEEDVGITQVFEFIADATDVRADAVSHEPSADGNAVNIQDMGNKVANTSGKERETERVIHKGRVSDSCRSWVSATTTVDSTLYDSRSTVVRRKTQMKRQLCELSTSKDNVKRKYIYCSNSALFRGTTYACVKNH